MKTIDFSRMITPADRAALARRQQIETALAEADAALVTTDWQVIRQAEGGTALTPAERAVRKEARATISRLRDDLASLPPLKQDATETRRG